MKVVHVIVGLGVGGAETMLYKLLGTLDRDSFEPTVVSLMAGGELAGPVRDLGVPVHALGMRRGLISPPAVVRLRGLARELAPDLVMGWMYHGNLAGLLLQRWSPGHPRLVWNIRQSLYGMGWESPRTRPVIHLGARLSRRPERIIFNSTVAIGQHAAVGFETRSAEMVPNGFDLDRYGPDPAAGAALRQELGVPGAGPLVGIVGRYHPIKGHADFLAAAAQVQHTHPQARFVLIGLGLDGSDPELGRLAAALPRPDQVHWLGLRRDVPRLMAGLDLLVLASHSEGFPNVVGEAMACGTPCVATAVGEAAQVVGDCGRVVSPGHPAELAAAIGELLNLSDGDRRALGEQARGRIRTHYSLAAVADRFAALMATAPDGGQA